MRIFIEEYNTEWAKGFSILKAKLTKKLLSKKPIEIEHIGSTSVLNLASKPVIDVLIGVHKDNLDNHIKPITELGFFYVKEYEKEIPNRRFFYKNKNNKRSAHIHLVESSSLWFRRHIAFRNELRENSKTKIEYEKLKKALAKKEWKDGNEYADAKTDFIKSVEKKLNLY